MLGLEELLGMPPIHELKLIVEDSTSTSFTEAHLSQNVMAEHGIWFGDSKVLLGKDGFKTVCTILTDSSSKAVVGDDKIKLNSVIRGKLGVSVGDSITILKNEIIPRSKIVSFVPIKKWITKDLESVNLFEAYLRPYFKDAFRPVHKGNVLNIELHNEEIQFKITNIDPTPFGIVGPGTIIECQKGAQLIQETEKLKSTEEPTVSVTVLGPIIDLSSAELLAGGPTKSLIFDTDGFNTEPNKGPNKFQLTKPETPNAILTSLPGSCSQDSNSTKVSVGDSEQKSKTVVQVMEAKANIGEVISSPVPQQTTCKPMQHVSPMVDQRSATQCDRSTQNTKDDEAQSQTSIMSIVPRKGPEPEIGSVSVRMLRSGKIVATAEKEIESCPSKRPRKFQSKEKSNVSGQQITHNPAAIEECPKEVSKDVPPLPANKSNDNSNIKVIKKKYLAFVKELKERHAQEISSLKKKQWCVNCEREAVYHCCWNTANTQTAKNLNLGFQKLAPIRLPFFFYVHVLLLQ